MTTAQEPKNMCQTHFAEDIDMYCYSCSERFCSKCIKENHRSHEWEVLNKVVKQKRMQIPTKCKNVKEKQIPEILRNIEQLQAAKHTVSQRKSDLLERVSACKNRIVMATENITEKISSVIELENQEINKKIDTELMGLKNDIEVLEALMDTLDQQKMSGSNHNIMDLEECLDAKLNRIKELNIDDLTKGPSFVEGMVNTKVLETMFGWIENKSEPGNNAAEAVLTFSADRPKAAVTEVASFTYGDRFIRAVCAVREMEAWVHQGNSADNALLTIDGENIQQIDADEVIAHFTMMNGTDTFYTNFEGCSINRITSTGQRSTVVDTSPLHPWGLSISLCGDLLVTLMDDKNCRNDDKRQCLVQQVSLSGTVKNTYRFHNATNEALFILPYRVCQNYNTDICVIDRPTKITGRLFILGSDGALKNEYVGQGQESSTDLTDVLCDYNCNIIVSDSMNHKIHLLDSHGKLLKFLISDKQKLQFPNSLSLYNDNLWVGCRYGKVHVFKYRY